VRQSIADVRIGTTVPAVLCALVAASPGCGEREETVPPATTAEDPTGGPPAAEPPPADGERSKVRGDAGGGEPAVLSRSERLAVRAAEDYIAAIDAREGSRVCELLVPGASEAIELPRDRGGCAPSLDASFGYRDPRGFPVWQSSTLEAIDSVDTSAGTATVLATIFTRFADRPEPSVEDDPIYLRREGGRWLVAKPSLTLYRAVGFGEPPPAAISPPEG
jgi:hypothetical protein